MKLLCTMKFPPLSQVIWRSFGGFLRRESVQEMKETITRAHHSMMLQSMAIQSKSSKVLYSITTLYSLEREPGIHRLRRIYHEF